MYRAFRNLKDCVFHNPLSLASMDNKFKCIASNYLPFSTGIEIECSPKTNSWDKLESLQKELRLTPNLMDFNVQDSQEIDLRIPSGVNGLICLYEMCSKIKENFNLNPRSGIHYHVDFTPYWERFRHTIHSERFKEIVSSICLSELDTWGYEGSYNKRGVCRMKGEWIRVCHTYRTIEFRIGEMSFEYEVLAKRIIHCNSLVKKVAEALLNKV